MLSRRLTGSVRLLAQPQVFPALVQEIHKKHARTLRSIKQRVSVRLYQRNRSISAQRHRDIVSVENESAVDANYRLISMCVEMSGSAASLSSSELRVALANIVACRVKELPSDATSFAFETVTRAFCLLSGEVSALSASPPTSLSSDALRALPPTCPLSQEDVALAVYAARAIIIPSASIPSPTAASDLAIAIAATCASLSAHVLTQHAILRTISSRAAQLAASSGRGTSLSALPRAARVALVDRWASSGAAVAETAALLHVLRAAAAVCGARGLDARLGVLVARADARGDDAPVRILLGALAGSTRYGRAELRGARLGRDARGPGGGDGDGDGAGDDGDRPIGDDDAIGPKATRGPSLLGSTLAEVVHELVHDLRRGVVVTAADAVSVTAAALRVGGDAGGPAGAALARSLHLQTAVRAAASAANADAATAAAAGGRRGGRRVRFYSREGEAVTSTVSDVRHIQLRRLASSPDDLAVGAVDVRAASQVVDAALAKVPPRDMLRAAWWAATSAAVHASASPPAVISLEASLAASSGVLGKLTALRRIRAISRQPPTPPASVRGMLEYGASHRTAVAPRGVASAWSPLAGVAPPARLALDVLRVWGQTDGGARALLRGVGRASVADVTAAVRRVVGTSSALSATNASASLAGDASGTTHSARRGGRASDAPFGRVTLRLSGVARADRFDLTHTDDSGGADHDVSADGDDDLSATSPSANTPPVAPLLPPGLLLASASPSASDPALRAAHMARAMAPLGVIAAPPVLAERPHELHAQATVAAHHIAVAALKTLRLAPGRSHVAASAMPSAICGIAAAGVQHHAVVGFVAQRLRLVLIRDAQYFDLDALGRFATLFGCHWRRLRSHPIAAAFVSSGLQVVAALSQRVVDAAAASAVIPSAQPDGLRGTRTAPGTAPDDDDAASDGDGDGAAGARAARPPHTAGALCPTTPADAFDVSLSCGLEWFTTPVPRAASGPRRVTRGTNSSVSAESVQRSPTKAAAVAAAGGHTATSAYMRRLLPRAVREDVAALHTATGGATTPHAAHCRAAASAGPAIDVTTPAPLILSPTAIPVPPPHPPLDPTADVAPALLYQWVFGRVPVDAAAAAAATAQLIPTVRVRLSSSFPATSRFATTAPPTSASDVASLSFEKTKAARSLPNRSAAAAVADDDDAARHDAVHWAARHGRQRVLAAAPTIGTLLTYWRSPTALRDLVVGLGLGGACRGPLLVAAGVLLARTPPRTIAAQWGAAGCADLLDGLLAASRAPAALSSVAAALPSGSVDHASRVMGEAAVALLAALRVCGAAHMAGAAPLVLAHIMASPSLAFSSDAAAARAAASNPPDVLALRAGTAVAALTAGGRALPPGQRAALLGPLAFMGRASILDDGDTVGNAHSGISGMGGGGRASSGGRGLPTALGGAVDPMVDPLAVADDQSAAPASAGAALGGPRRAIHHPAAAGAGVRSSALSIAPTVRAVDVHGSHPVTSATALTVFSATTTSAPVGRPLPSAPAPTITVGSAIAQRFAAAALPAHLRPHATLPAVRAAPLPAVAPQSRPTRLDDDRSGGLALGHVTVPTAALAWVLEVATRKATEGTAVAATVAVAAAHALAMRLGADAVELVRAVSWRVGVMGALHHAPAVAGLSVCAARAGAAAASLTLRVTADATERVVSPAAAAAAVVAAAAALVVDSTRQVADAVEAAAAAVGWLAVTVGALGSAADARAACGSGTAAGAWRTPASPVSLSPSVATAADVAAANVPTAKAVARLFTRDMRAVAWGTAGAQRAPHVLPLPAAVATEAAAGGALLAARGGLVGRSTLAGGSLAARRHVRGERLGPSDVLRLATAAVAAGETSPQLVAAAAAVMRTGAKLPVGVLPDVLQFAAVHAGLLASARDDLRDLTKVVAAAARSDAGAAGAVSGAARSGPPIRVDPQVAATVHEVSAWALLRSAGEIVGTAAAAAAAAAAVAARSLDDPTSLLPHSAKAFGVFGRYSPALQSASVAAAVSQHIGEGLTPLVALLFEPDVRWLAQLALPSPAAHPMELWHVGASPPATAGSGLSAFRGIGGYAAGGTAMRSSFVFDDAVLRDIVIVLVLSIAAPRTVGTRGAFPPHATHLALVLAAILAARVQTAAAFERERRRVTAAGVTRRVTGSAAEAVFQAAANRPPTPAERAACDAVRKAVVPNGTVAAAIHLARHLTVATPYYGGPLARAEGLEAPEGEGPDPLVLLSLTRSVRLWDSFVGGGATLSAPPGGETVAADVSTVAASIVGVHLRAHTPSSSFTQEAKASATRADGGRASPSSGERDGAKRGAKRSKRRRDVDAGADAVTSGRVGAQPRGARSADDDDDSGDDVVVSGVPFGGIVRVAFRGLTFAFIPSTAAEYFAVRLPGGSVGALSVRDALHDTTTSGCDLASPSSSASVAQHIGEHRGAAGGASGSAAPGSPADVLDMLNDEPADEFDDHHGGDAPSVAHAHSALSPIDGSLAPAANAPASADRALNSREQHAATPNPQQRPTSLSAFSGFSQIRAAARARKVADRAAAVQKGSAVVAVPAHQPAALATTAPTRATPPTPAALMEQLESHMHPTGALAAVERLVFLSMDIPVVLRWDARVVGDMSADDRMRYLGGLLLRAYRDATGIDERDAAETSAQGAHPALPVSVYRPAAMLAPPQLRLSWGEDGDDDDDVPAGNTASIPKRLT